MKTLFLLYTLLLISAGCVYAQLPDPGFKIDKSTAIVITDPQNEFLSPQGKAWALVGPSVEANNTIANIETLFELGEKYKIPVFISPHYYYPHDREWKAKGAISEFINQVKLFDRKSPLSLEGFEGSGADFLEKYKKYINSPNVTVVSPHKVYGPQSNDLVLQLREMKIDKVILAGMLSNLCVESHLRELVEQGFEVAVVKDATAAAILPDMNGYEIAVVNFRQIASHVYTTKELQKAIETK
ncbi:MAG: cysteine hydrolase [Ignavibacteria bacterium]|nr:cysteine hydrolase [Ignavibacteria bacterium]